MTLLLSRSPSRSLALPLSLPLSLSPSPSPPRPLAPSLSPSPLLSRSPALSLIRPPTCLLFLPSPLTLSPSLRLLSLPLLLSFLLSACCFPHLFPSSSSSSSTCDFSSSSFLKFHLSSSFLSAPYLKFFIASPHPSLYLLLVFCKFFFTPLTCVFHSSFSHNPATSSPPYPVVSFYFSDLTLPQYDTLLSTDSFSPHCSIFVFSYPSPLISICFCNYRSHSPYPPCNGIGTQTVESNRIDTSYIVAMTLITRPSMSK